MKYLAVVFICLLAVVLLCFACPASAQTEPYASASIADFSKAGYSSPYWDLGAGVESETANALVRLDSYWSPTKKAGVTGSATTFGGSADAFWKDGSLLLGAGLVGGETRTSEFISHGFRYEGEAGLEFGATDQPGGRVRIVGRYEGPISDPHNFHEFGLTLSARFRKLDPYISFTRFTTDVTGSQYSAQVGVKFFPF